MMTYVPLAQTIPDAAAGQILGFFNNVNVIVRSDRDPSSVVAGVRNALERLDPALPVPRMQSVTDIVSESVKPQRFSMTVVALFAGVALALAAIGIYGVLANVVTQQTHEIGVRVALGATASDVLWMVLRRALALMAAGVAMGVAGALALTRVMTGLLYEVRPTDAVTFLGAALVLAVLALVASLVPAWRATRVDPLIALRAE
jgi:ABC-type antimicrobial peptide transport system permease subunit